MMTLKRTVLDRGLRTQPAQQGVSCWPPGTIEGSGTGHCRSAHGADIQGDGGWSSGRNDAEATVGHSFSHSFLQRRAKMPHAPHVQIAAVRLDAHMPDPNKLSEPRAHECNPGKTDTCHFSLHVAASFASCPPPPSARISSHLHWPTTTVSPSLTRKHGDT